jgi:hypothetical protein
MTLTDAEKDLLTRRNSPDLTPRDFLLATELQVRVQLQQIPESAAMLAELETLRSAVLAADFNTAGIGYLNNLGQQMMALHHKAMTER